MDKGFVSHIKEMPLLSVVVPIHNSQDYLHQCIDSILSQSFADFELICVDDASSDDSADIIRDYQAKDRRVSLICLDNASGSGAKPRNKGLNEARGKYVFFLDSDDYFDCTMFEKMVCAAEERCADLVMCDSYNYLCENDKLSTDHTELHRDILKGYLSGEVFSRKDIPDSIYQISNAAVWHRLFLRDMLISNGITFQEGVPILDDIFFCNTTILLSKRITIVDERLVFYRKGRTEGQTSAIEKNLSSVFLPFFESNKWLIDHRMYDEVKTSLQTWTISTMKWWLDSVLGTQGADLLMESYRSSYFKELLLLDDNLDRNVPLYYKDFIDQVMCGEYARSDRDILLEFHKDTINDKRVIVYGAGKNAYAQIPSIKKEFEIVCVWDKDPKKERIFGIKVSRPTALKDKNIPILITIGDDRIYTDVKNELKELGYLRFYHGKDIAGLCDILPEGLWAKESLESIRFIDDSCPAVNYIIVDTAIQPQLSLNREKTEWVVDSICEKTNADMEDITEHITSFIDKCIVDESVFFCEYEASIRSILKDNLKTKYRPIRMTGDKPYDDFANSVVQMVILEGVTEDRDQMLALVRQMMSLTNSGKVLRGIEALLLAQLEEYDEAIACARDLAKDYPTDFFSNETLYSIQICCRKSGIAIEEPLPCEDLDSRFCWSGMNYAWCGGIKGDGSAMFGPCFRAVECAARPGGDFWIGEEWELFRESLLDGSFRYCQKNQCANIIGGWLPIKDRVDMSSLPGKGPKELHLSYDSHCNLKCPSCRTSFVHLDSDAIACMDDFFEKEISEHIKDAKHLCLSGSGEAILSPHSKKIIQSLTPKEYPNLKIELRTNMTLLNKKMWESLGEGRTLIRHIASSVDACTKETFEKLRYPASWDVVMSNLCFVRELRKRNEIDLFEFHVVVQKDNIDELVGIAKLAEEFEADVVTYSKIINWRGMPREEYDKLNPFWIDNPNHKKLLRVINELKQYRESSKCLINIHFEPDPDERYDSIRYGELKIR